MTGKPPHEPGGPRAGSSNVDGFDRDRIARVRAGDEREFEAVFREYYDPLCRYVARLLGNRDAAEDIVQGVFGRIWRDRARWTATDIRSYVYAAVRLRVISEFRRGGVRRRAAPHLRLESQARSRVDTPEEELEAEELRQRFERALASLPPRTREAFLLSRGEGKSYDEVALVMGISHKTVGVHIGKALAALRKALGGGRSRRGGNS